MNTEAIGDTAGRREIPTRKAQFFRLVADQRDGPKGSPPVDWVKTVATALSQAPPPLAFADPISQEYVFGKRTDRVIAIAKPVAGPAVQMVDHFQAIRPLSVEELDAYLAFTTYVHLYPFNAFGIISGMPGVPRAGAVASLANHLHPLRDGGRWRASALMEPGQVERFGNLRGGVKKLVVKATATPPDLFNHDPTVTSIHDYLTKLSGAVGSEISVELSIRVRKPGSHTASLRSLLGLVKPEELYPIASKVQITSEDQEILDLLDHDMAVTFDLSVLDGGIDLGLMVSDFEDVATRMEDRIRQAVVAAEA